MTLKVIQENSEQWYRDGLSFSCTQCGNCCTGAPGYVWISKVEIERLAEHLNITTDQVIEKYCRKIGNRVSLQERRTAQGNYDCIFLHEQPETKKRTCTVYPVRPLQCRTWPFWDGNLASHENWQRAARRCPGMDKGRQYSLKQIESLRTAEDWK
jgi:Fe-S-cluster containining protein